MSLARKRLLMMSLIIIPFLGLLSFYVSEKWAWIDFANRERTGIVHIKNALDILTRIHPQSESEDIAFEQAYKSFTEDIGTHSGLILDPEAESYFHASILVNAVPELLVYAAEANLMLKNHVASKHNKSAELVRISVGLRLGMGKLGHTIEFTNIDGAVKEAFDSVRLDADDVLTGLSRLSESDGDFAQAVGAGQISFDRLESRLMQFNEKLLDKTDLLLVKRLDRLYREMATALAITLLSVILSALIFYRVSYGISRPLKLIDNAIADSNSNPDVIPKIDWPTQDEMGRLAATLNQYFLDQYRQRELIAENAKLSQSALLAAKRFSAIMDGSDVGIYEIDFTTGSVFYNDSLKRILGKPADWTPTTGYLISLLKPETQNTISDHILRMEQGEKVRMEGTLHLEDGRDIWVRWAAAGIMSDGTDAPALDRISDTAKALIHPNSKVRGLIGSIEDITAEREARIAIETARAQEAALTAAAAAKDIFFANMTHELRTPVAAISNYVQLIEEDLTDGAIDTKSLEQDILKIRGATVHLRRLVDNVLDMSKIEAGHLELDIEPTDIGQILTEIEAISQPLGQAKGLSVHISAGAFPPFVLLDRLRLNQILLNLISNAIKFTDHGNVSLRVYVTGQQLNFEVTDTGMGMTPATLAKLFDAYAQGDRTIAKRHGGTGLGLALSMKLARLMGGTIRVESQINIGSTFTVELPLRPSMGDGQ